MLNKINQLLNFKYSFSAFVAFAMAIVINLYYLFNLPIITLLSIVCIAFIIIGRIFFTNINLFYILAAFFIFGLGSSYIYNNNFRVFPVPEYVNNESLWVKGVVSNIKKRNKYVSIELNKPIIYSELLDNVRVRKLLVNTYYSRVEDLKIGDEFVARVMLQKPSNGVFIDDFDYEQYLLQNNINLLAQVRGQIYTTEPDRGYSFLQTLKNYRLKVANKILAVDDSSTNVISAALITGLRGDVSYDVKDDFKNSGLAHLMAISGMHMAFLAIIIFIIVRYAVCSLPFIALNYDSKKIAAFVTVLVSFGYLVLAGFNLPTLRAFIMVLLFAITLMLNRNRLAIHTLAVCAILILLFDPMAIFSASFQLSFSAVLAMLLYNYLHEQDIILDYSYKAKIWRNFIATLNISIIAFCATMFVVAVHFSYISIYSVLANVIASFLMAFIVMPCLFAYFIGYILLDIELFSHLNDFSLSLLLNLAQYFAGFSNSSVYVSYGYSLVVLVISLTIISLFIFGYARKYLLSFILLIVLFIIPIKVNLKPEIIVIENQGVILINNDNYSVLGDVSKRDIKKIARFYRLEYKNVKLAKICDVSGCVYEFKGQKILHLNEGFSITPEDKNLVDYYF